MKKQEQNTEFENSKTWLPLNKPIIYDFSKRFRSTRFEAFLSKFFVLLLDIFSNNPEQEFF